MINKRKAVVLLVTISIVSVFFTIYFYNNISCREYLRAKKSLEQHGYSMSDLEKYIFEYSYEVDHLGSKHLFSGKEEYYLDGYKFKLFSEFMKR